MRKLIMWNLITLDGFFEGLEPWSLDFHMTAWGEELQAMSDEQAAATGMLLFGRKTYDGMMGYWTSADADANIAAYMNGAPKALFSRTRKEGPWENTQLVSADAVADVAKLKAQPGKDLFVFGSAELSAPLLEAGLFDELRVCVCPVVLGAGTPLFKPGARKNLTLTRTQPLQTGGVILRYQPA